MECSTPEKRSGSLPEIDTKRPRLSSYCEEDDGELPELSAFSQRNEGGYNLGEFDTVNATDDLNCSNATTDPVNKSSASISEEKDEVGQDDAEISNSITKLTDSMKSVSRNLFPAEMALWDKIEKLGNELTEHPEKLDEFTDLKELYDEIQREKRLMREYGDYTEGEFIEGEEDLEGEENKFLYIEVTKEQCAREFEEASDDEESESDLEPLFASEGETSMIVDEPGSLQNSELKYSIGYSGYDPLDDLTDSEDELVSPEQPQDESQRISVDGESSSSVKESCNDQQSVQKKRRLRNPFDGTVNGEVALVNNVVCKRWQQINGHDLHFVGSILSVGGCDFSLFGRSNLKWDREHSMFIKWTKEDAEEEALVKSHNSEEPNDRRPALLEKDFEKRLIFTPPECVDLWTFLTENDGLKDVPFGSDEGWVNLVEVYRHMLDHRNIPPPIAFRRIMLQGLRDFPLLYVKLYIYQAMDLTFKVLSPGPSDLYASKFYLEGMSNSLKPGVPGENEPWVFLCDLIERSLREPDREPDMLSGKDDLADLKRPKFDEFGIGDNPIMIMAGSHMLLQFWINVLDADYLQWHQKFVAEDTISFDGIERPLVARALFLTKEIEWNKRCEEICHQYVVSVTRSSSPLVRGLIRKLVGLLAQLLSLAETLKDEGRKRDEDMNHFKMKIAEYIANRLDQEEIDNDLLKKELFLLEPSWLSSALSTFCLGNITGISFSIFPNMSTIISNFVNVPLDTKAESQDNEEDLESPANKSKQNAMESIQKASMDPRLKRRNKYGEYQLHVACRNKDPSKLQALLEIPGVNVNVVDHSNNTPLHEAVYVGNLNSVLSLLNFVPREASCLDNSASGSPMPYVNLLAENDSAHNPVQYAVSHERPYILRAILDFVVEKQGDECSPFPTLATIFNAPGPLEDLTDNTDMKNIVREYKNMLDPRARKKMRFKHPDENLLQTIPMSIVQSEVFQMLLKNSLSRYVAANNLDMAYHLLGTVKGKQLCASKIQERLDNGEFIPLKQELERYHPLELSNARPYYMFNSVPKCDVQRSSATIDLDMKRFERFVLWKRQLSDLDPRNKVCQLPGIMFNFDPTTKD